MKKIIQTDKAPAAIGPYSQAVEINNTLYISGQLPLDPQTMNMPDSLEEQAEQVMKNTGAILREAGYDYQNVVKSTIFLDDINDFQKMNQVYGKYYQQDPPARSAYEVGNLPKGAKIEIETIAAKWEIAQEDNPSAWNNASLGPFLIKGPFFRWTRHRPTETELEEVVAIGALAFIYPVNKKPAQPVSSFTDWLYFY